MSAAAPFSAWPFLEMHFLLHPDGIIRERDDSNASDRHIHFADIDVALMVM